MRWMLAATLAVGLVACGRGQQQAGEGQQGQGQGGKAGSALATSSPYNPGVPVSGGQGEPTLWLDAVHELELPRSTAAKATELPWQEVTPTVAPAQAGQGAGQKGEGGKGGEGGSGEGGKGGAGGNGSRDNDKGGDGSRDNDKGGNGSRDNDKGGKGQEPQQGEGGKQAGENGTRGPNLQAPVAPTWLRPAVLIGRRQVWVHDKPVAQVRCKGEAGLCAPEALRGPTGKVVLDFDPAVVGDEGLRPLAQAVRTQGWAGKPVLLLADRRIAWSAIDAARRAIQAAGARPVMMAATYAGEPALLLDPDQAHLPPPAAGMTAEPSPTASETGDPFPADATGVVVHVSAQGVGLELQRGPGQESQRPELLGNVTETLAAWAVKIRGAKPALDGVAVLIEPEAPYEEIARVVDALRDSCARVAKGTPCHQRQPLFPRIELTLTGQVPPTPQPVPGVVPPETQAVPPAPAPSPGGKAGATP